jgi:alkanesulfonate monooxygenase SsuD/methylene tetrahydromethanopterin reductase-like flavin-dependent oxidoreductase (luciferase family)
MRFVHTHSWVERGQQQVRFGILSQSHGDWPRFREHAQQVEAFGFDGIWVYDHPLSFGSADCWIALSELARATSTIRLGSSVSCVPYRHPAVLARMAADVDQLSGGRLVLGLGIGDDPVEFAQLGIPFGAAKPRQRLLEETVRAVRQLWTGQPVTLNGEAVQLENAQLLNGPLQPHVPILIAGGGERVTLRQVADYADACNFGPYSWTGGAYTRSDVERKYAALRKHCAAAGRPYDSVLRSYYTMLIIAATREEAEATRAAVPTMEEFRSEIFAGTVEDAVAHYQALADLGVQYFIAWVPPGDDLTLRLLAEEVMPALRPG